MYSYAALEEHIVEERSPTAGVREVVIQFLQSVGDDDEESCEDSCVQHVLELLQSGLLNCLLPPPFTFYLSF